jgi:hypothetical protein
VREIVRVAKNSHGGDLPKCPQGPDLSGFIAGAARGIRTPDPVITNEQGIDYLGRPNTTKATAVRTK